MRLTALIIAFCLLTPSTLRAGHSEHRMGLHNQLVRSIHTILVNAEDLGLSDFQIKSINDLKLKTEQLIIRAEAEKNIIMLDLNEELSKSSPSQASVNAFIDQKMEIKTVLEKNIADGLLTIKTYLSEEQMKKLDDLL